MKNQYSNQSKQHTDDELANTAAKRVDIVKIQMVKDKSRLLYKYRAINLPERWLPIDAPVFWGCRP